MSNTTQVYRDEFVREYLQHLVTDGMIYHKGNSRVISDLLYSSNPIELSKLGRALDYGLVMGVASPSLSAGLNRFKIDPALFGRVYPSGLALTACDPFAIQWLRQVLLFAKKFPGKTEEEESVTLTNCADRLRVSGSPRLVLESDRECAARLLGHLPDDLSLFCSHGPGAVRDGESGRTKWDWSYEPRNRGSWLFCNERHELDQYMQISPAQEPRTARATIVPKDFRRGRVIAIEGKENMFVGQAYKAYLYTRLSQASAGQIEFEDQEKHRDLLRDPGYISLDLEDASDRVSRTLLRRLLPREWFQLCDDMRPCMVQFPGETVRSRAAFSMGNPLCFPIEALVHYVAVRRVVPFYERVSVYGDDLIVPKKYAIPVMESLEDFGLRPSPHKSCFRTTFKESCGLDLLDSVDITPSYLKLNEGVAIASAIEALQLVSAQQHHWIRGFFTTAKFIAEIIERFVRIPYSPIPHPWKLLGEGSFNGRSRFHRDLQRIEYRVPVLETHRQVTLSGWSALHQYFLKGSITVSEKRRVPRLRFAWMV